MQQVSQSSRQACPGHLAHRHGRASRPSTSLLRRKAWMPATSAGMTKELRLPVGVIGKGKLRRPCSLKARGTPCPFFRSPKGNGAPEGARGLRGPIRTLRGSVLHAVKAGLRGLPWDARSLGEGAAPPGAPPQTSLRSLRALGRFDRSGLFLHRPRRVLGLISDPSLRPASPPDTS